MIGVVIMPTDAMPDELSFVREPYGASFAWFVGDARYYFGLVAQLVRAGRS